MKPPRVIIFILLFFSLTKTFAQEKVKLVKANSPKVTIKDGWEGKTKYWNHLIKSKSPIVYHLAKNCKKRQVIFYTDVDSISMNIEGESNYQFKVLLNKYDTCTVILTTKNHQYVRLNNNQNKTDTLSFELNKNKQIIIKGSINNSPKMNFCFDLGARLVYVIGRNFDKLNKLTLDGIMEDESVTGLSTEKTSSNNSLQLGNLNISNMPMCYIDEAGFLENGGAFIGYNVFQNKILEIDFDNKLLLIHNELPRKNNTYSQIEFKQTTGGLYVPITISNGKKVSKGWYFFDTGADNALSFDSRFAKKENLYNTMKVIGKAGIASSENRVIDAEILEVPEVTIASYKLENVPTLLANESNAESVFEDGVIGIGLQSRFNFIIDYPNSKMYIKPSKYFNDSFEKKDKIATNLILGLSLALGLLLAVFFVYKKSKVSMNYFRINMLFFLIFTLVCNSCSTLKSTTYPITKNYKPDDKQLYETIVKLDSIFFGAYNTCNTNLEKYGSFFSENIEFYHDQGGLMTSKQDIIDATKRNICGKVTRELVKGSIEVYPIKDFGAIEIGLHKFHNNQEPVGTTSKAGRFMVIWENKNNDWKIRRVVSLH
ncbi:MAG TPA: DUF4440 domain-containing protein [Saprospiraceae bacterium]|nr:DUF4440 domain-containing protein [Saprospiraceae bacterium]